MFLEERPSCFPVEANDDDVGRRHTLGGLIRIVGIWSSVRVSSGCVVCDRYRRRDRGNCWRGASSLPSRTMSRLGLASACAVFALGCAFNRAEVKSLRDSTAARIQFAVIDTTISALNAI